MPHTFEPAATGRSKCRGCKQAIAKGELRFGERLPNPFADGEVTHWFHPRCAAYKIPQEFIDGVAVATIEIPDRESLEAAANFGLTHRRVPRIDGAERSPSSQARCRNCKETIEKGAWRIRLVFHEEGNFSPGGFVHYSCRRAYFETGDILEHLLHFSPTLGEDDRKELQTQD
jgi:Poly(ADP-ribose) polymerase and DNA-Ligase Zn-finger region